MRAAVALAMIATLVLVAVFSASCGSTPALDTPDTVGPREFKNSGRTISGVYTQTGSQRTATITFTADGSWSRIEPVQSGTRSTSGTYLVDDKGRLVLYLEAVGDARLGTAEESVYDITGDLVGSFELRDRAGREQSFVRTGDEPPPEKPR